MHTYDIFYEKCIIYSHSLTHALELKCYLPSFSNISYMYDIFSTSI